MTVVATELERIADPAGAAGAVWRRLGREEWQTLPEALDHPDGDRLYAAQWKKACARRSEREAAEREAKRPTCVRVRRRVHRRALAGDHTVFVAGRVGPTVRSVRERGRRPRGD
ncbi:hypothetical protein [Streptomyces fradiae]|uniref:hypothetical protein n=1 Tax=Streptomyces fradiae TaxID=1906 RepID=UPI003985A5EA